MSIMEDPQIRGVSRMEELHKKIQNKERRRPLGMRKKYWRKRR